MWMQYYHNYITCHVFYLLQYSLNICLNNFMKIAWDWLSKWNESGFRPHLCTYRLNWDRRTSWGWWDDWDDTLLQTQDSKFEPWRSEAEHANSRSRRLPTILTFTRGCGRNIFCFFQSVENGNRTPNSGVKGSGANHYPRAPARDWPNNQRKAASLWTTLHARQVGYVRCCHPVNGWRTLHWRRDFLPQYKQNQNTKKWQ